MNIKRSFVHLLWVKYILITSWIVIFSSCRNAGGVRNDLDRPDSGVINISVDESFKPIIDSQIEVFEALYPKTKIHVHYKPEADCLKDLYHDKGTKAVIVTRGLTIEEERYFKDSLKYIPRYDKIAYDAVAAIVHPQSPDSFVTMSKIRGLLSGSTGDKEKIVVDGLTATSTVRYVMDSLLKGKPFDTSKVLAVKGSEAVIDYVAQHNGVIGLIGVNWIGNKEDDQQLSFLKKVRIASVDCILCGTDIYVKPYQANILYKRYPMVRGLYYILKENYNGLGTGFTSFLSQERGQLIFKRAYLAPAKMDFTLRQAMIK